MDKKAIRRWRRDVFRIVASVGFRGGTPEHSAGMILAAVAAIGHDPTALSNLTGFTRPFIVKVLRRLRKSRVLSGQKLQAPNWTAEGLAGTVAFACDAMIAAGEMNRSPDPKRSAAHKGKHGGPRAPRKPPTKVSPGAVFTPQWVESNPLYGLSEWDTDPKRAGR